jgi:hypothetical protein
MVKSRTTSISDTGSDAATVLIAGYRRMSHLEKLEQVGALTRSVQELALRDIRRRHPQAGPRETRLRLASRWIEPELMLRFFDWDPAIEGY